ncbi:MAG: hypothetical protein M0Z48_06005 [Nitrospiraceae bacterium]|nr:hypothetical protein [Nitrospiraceae bacterium]
MSKMSAGCHKAGRRKDIFPILLTLGFLCMFFSGCGSNFQYIRNMHDQGKLAEIAVKDSNPAARRVAVTMLTDQSLLAKIALDDKDPGVRGAATWRITDQSLLAKIAAETRSVGVRTVAMERLTDPVLLARFALENKDKKIRLSAVETIKDHALLTKVALNDSAWEVRRAAARKITDQTVLAKIALADKDRRVRKTAAGALTDQALLARISTEGQDEEVRGIAAAKLKDQDIQKKIALGDKDPYIRSVAVGKLTDKALLASIAKNGQDAFVCETAYERLDDLNHYPLLAVLRSKSGAQDKIKSLLTSKVSKEELTAALLEAVRLGDWKICNMLISAGADINSLDCVNVLYLAVPDPKITEALLQNGARVDDIKGDSENPVQAAFAYQWLARFMEKEIKQGRLPLTLKGYMILAYEIAARHFDFVAKNYGRKANWGIVKEIGVALAGGAYAGLSQMQAAQQSNQLAQVGALRHAADYGGGIQGYDRALTAYESAANQEVLATEPAHLASAQNSINAAADTVWGSAETDREKEHAAQKLADECKKKAACYKKTVSGLGSCYDLIKNGS